MTIYADTSFLVSLYTFDANSAAAARLMSSAPLPVVFTSLGELELTNTFHLRVFRRDLTSDEIKHAFDLFREDLSVGILALKSLPDNAFRTAMRLSRNNSASLGSRTLDILHVACALDLKTDRLFTFDNAQRRLAKSKGLACS